MPNWFGSVRQIILGLHSSSCPGWGQFEWNAWSAQWGRRLGGVGPQKRRQSSWGSGTVLFCGGHCTWCIYRIGGRSRNSGWPDQQLDRFWGWMRRLLRRRCSVWCQVGWPFQVWPEGPQGCRFSASGQDFCPVQCGHGRREAFLGRGVYLGGGSAQLPPMPDKPNISQVGTLGTWSTGRVGPCVHIPTGFQFKGGMSLGE